MEKVIDASGTELPMTPELRALVDAYTAYWKATFKSEPKGDHPIVGLDVMIEFDSQIARAA